MIYTNPAETEVLAPPAIGTATTTDETTSAAHAATSTPTSSGSPFAVATYADVQGVEASDLGAADLIGSDAAPLVSADGLAQPVTAYTPTLPLLAAKMGQGTAEDMRIVEVVCRARGLVPDYHMAGLPEGQNQEVATRILEVRGATLHAKIGPFRGEHVRELNYT